jgi:elongator complex protein 3
LLIELKKIVPEYCRITRLYRDIPAESIIGGTRISNLRQYVQAEMVERGEKCRCIRCREIKGDDFDPKNVKLIVREYDSSSGKEYFLSFEDIKNDKIVGYLRLRIPSCYKNHWIGELTNSTIIRELHVFGEHVKVNNRLEKAGQHKGYGKKLIEKAVELTKSYNIPRLAVISGVGVRDYYRKLGFKDGGLYQFLKIK